MIEDRRPNFARVYGPGSFINYRDLGRRKAARIMGFSRRTLAALGAFIVLLALSLSIAGIVGYDVGRSRCELVEATEHLDQLEHRMRVERDGRWGEDVAPRGDRPVFISSALANVAAAPAIFAQPAPAPSVTPVPELGPDDTAGAFATAMKALEAGRSKRWETAIGFALMLLVWVAHKPIVAAKVPKRYLGTFTLGIACLGGFGAAIAAGLPVLDSALTTMLLGAAAIGFWEAILKHVVEWLSPKEPEGL